MDIEKIKAIKPGFVYTRVTIPAVISSKAEGEFIQGIALWEAEAHFACTVLGDPTFCLLKFADIAQYVRKEPDKTRKELDAEWETLAALIGLHLPALPDDLDAACNRVQELFTERMKELIN